MPINDIAPHQRNLFSGFEALDTNLRSLSAAHEVTRAREIIDNALNENQNLERVANSLAILNNDHPGVLTKALVSNTALSHQVGAAYGTYAPWTAVVTPEECARVTQFICSEHPTSWQDSLSPAQSARTRFHTEKFVTEIQRTNTKFFDGAKIHLKSAGIVNNSLVLETCAANYSDNASISHYIGNRLYELADLDQRNLEANSKKILEVLRVLSTLDISPGENGIDISLGNPRLPHTLGISGMVLTSDGYLVRAKQGAKNMASGGDIVPAISGSADPSQLSTYNASFSPLEDFIREGGEEQQGAKVAYCAVAGVYQSLHRLGKPDVFLVAVLHQTAGEMFASQARNEKDTSRWELMKQIADSTYLGSLQRTPHVDLGDELRLNDLGAKITTEETPKLESGMRFGKLRIELDRAAVRSLTNDIRSGGRINHVDQISLIAGLEHLALHTTSSSA